MEQRITKPLHYHCAKPANPRFPRDCADAGQYRIRGTREGQRFAVAQKVTQPVPGAFIPTGARRVPPAMANEGHGGMGL